MSVSIATRYGMDARLPVGTGDSFFSTAPRPALGGLMSNVYWGLLPGDKAPQCYAETRLRCALLPYHKNLTVLYVRWEPNYLYITGDFVAYTRLFFVRLHAQRTMWPLA
jgi:hypothetical protein